MNFSQMTFSNQQFAGGKKKTTFFPDPFCDFASSAMPESKSDVLKLCEHVWLTSGMFKTAMQRIVRYFLTGIEFTGDISDTERGRYKEFLYDQLNIMDVAATVGDDFMCYGNSMTSMFMPFNRILTCTGCNFTRNINQVEKFGFDLKKGEFEVHCVKCKKKTKHTHKDLRSLDESRVRIVRWNPHQLELVHNFVSGENDYVWRVDEDTKKGITKGYEHILRTMPWEIIEAVQKNALFRFTGDSIYHIMEPTIAGVQNRGWGIPRMLGAFKDIYYVQLLKRYNETLALDYVMPFRVVTPQKAGTADPLMHHDANLWVNNLNSMLAEHRYNPTGYHVVPFPIQYQTLSGEGVQLSPYQLIKQGTEDMLDTIGVPAELYKGSMSIQSAPTALRLFQSSWPQLVNSMNGWLTWVVRQMSKFFGWEEIGCKLQPVTYADDIERKGVMLQLQAAQQVSKQTAFSFLDIDPKEERKRMMEEQKDEMEAQREFEEDQVKAQEMRDMSQQMAQGGGMMPPGGYPPAGYPAGDPAAAGGDPAAAAGGMPPTAVGSGLPMGNQVSGSPEAVMNEAQQMAQQIIGLDPATRRSQLVQLKHSNPMLHSVVKQMITDMEQQGAAQGVQQMRAQAVQGGM